MADVSTFPAKATAGLTFQATVTAAEYPPGWSFSLHLRGPAAINLAGAVGADGAVTFAATAAATAAWADGAYWWTIRATDGTDVHEVGTGQMQVLPDLASVTGTYDGRTQNEIALDAINAVLENRASQDQQRYVINNRELWRTPIAELLKLRSFYNTRVRRERRGAGGIGRNIPVRFS